MELDQKTRLDCPSLSRPAGIVTMALSVAVLALWLFPRYWYNYAGSNPRFFWLAQPTNVAGWTYAEVPVAKNAEAALAADHLVSGEFESTNQGRVKVFCANRHAENQNDIGLFAHTPDRCWTESGWKLEPATPDAVTVDIHGVQVQFERRIFVASNQRELVYFGGLVGGQPLPYRLDHNLSVGMRYALRAAGERTGTTLRASDKRFWTRVWDSFTSRSALLGPKQFIRVSTSIQEDDVARADALVRDLTIHWLKPVDYELELRNWKKAYRKADFEKRKVLFQIGKLKFGNCEI